MAGEPAGEHLWMVVEEEKMHYNLFLMVLVAPNVF
jgi:hypothetical protein